jgi:coenzyme F420-reducing hydrogenase gamma subunit
MLPARPFELTRTVEGGEWERRKVDQERPRYNEMPAVIARREGRLLGLERLYQARTELAEEVAKKESVGKIGVGWGCWFDTYNVLGGADKVIPVDFYIQGCPPRPEAILYGVALALGLAPKKVAEEKLKQETLRELAQGKSIVAKEGHHEKPR